MRFLLYQSIVPIILMVNALLNTIFIRVVEIGTYYVIFFMKDSSCSHKLKYKGYVEPICRCLS